MNQLMLTDHETGAAAWALCVLEPDELAAICNNDPAMIDLDPDDDTMPMLTIACEANSDHLQEILSTGDADKILAHLRHEAPKFADTLIGRRREDYERGVKQQPPRREQMVCDGVVPASQLNVAPACDVGGDKPDRIAISLSASGVAADVCYEVTNVVQADKIIELLISMRNRLWPQGRVET